MKSRIVKKRWPKVFQSSVCIILRRPILTLPFQDSLNRLDSLKFLDPHDRIETRRPVEFFEQHRQLSYWQRRSPHYALSGRPRCDPGKPARCSLRHNIDECHQQTAAHDCGSIQTCNLSHRLYDFAFKISGYNWFRGPITQAELNNLSEATAVSFLSALDEAVSTFAESGIDSSSNSRTAQVVQKISNIQSSILSQPGASSSDKLKNFLEQQ